MEGMFDYDQTTPNKASQNSAVPMDLPNIQKYTTMGDIYTPGGTGLTPHENYRLSQRATDPAMPSAMDSDMFAGYNFDSFQPGKDLGGGVYQDANGSYHSGPSGGSGINYGVTGQDKALNDWIQGVDSEYAAWQAGQDKWNAQKQAELDRYHAGLGEEEASQISRSGDTRGGGGSSMGGGSVYMGPVYDYPELNLPGPFEYGATLDLPDYKPPEYDEGEERAIREEYIQTSKGALSKAAQQAILGSSSVNNPQARGQIIRAALEGFGDALGGIALKGSEQGRKGAQAKYARDVGVYNTNFDIQSKEKIAEYDRALNEDLMNWELEVTNAQTEYKQNLANWNSMPVDYKAKSMGQTPGAY